MKDYNTLFRSLNYPSKPKKVEPKRESFKNNTEWGIALDAYETQFALDMQAYKDAMEKYREETRKLDTEFWAELYEDMYWDKLPASIARALQSLAWEEGHSSGYNEVYNVASSYYNLVDAIQKELK